jgi:glutamate/aspartate transport system substrate-binding protein
MRVHDQHQGTADAGCLFIDHNFVSKKSAGLRSFDDFKGRTVVSTAGTTSLRLLNELNSRKNLGMSIISAKDHAEAFLMVATDRASAFVMDDVLLAGLVANSQDPSLYEISKEFLSIEPYAIMVRREDAGFKQLVDAALGEAFRSGDFERTYRKWFEAPIPPRNINLRRQFSIRPIRRTLPRINRKLEQNCFARANAPLHGSRRSPIRDRSLSHDRRSQ